MRFNSLLNLIGFSGKAQGGPPVSGCVTNTRMPDSPAPSQGSFRADFRRYIPLSAFQGGLAGIFIARIICGSNGGALNLFRRVGYVAPGQQLQSYPLAQLRLWDYGIWYSIAQRFWVEGELRNSSNSADVVGFLDSRFRGNDFSPRGRGAFPPARLSPPSLRLRSGQALTFSRRGGRDWIPAFAGMTVRFEETMKRPWGYTPQLEN